MKYKETIKTIALTAIVVFAIGVIAGVQYQKGEDQKINAQVQTQVSALKK